MQKKKRDKIQNKFLKKNKKMKPIQLIILSVLLLGLFFYFVDPIRQPQSYHNFADQRTFLQIPNFFDAVSYTHLTLPTIA